MAEGASWLKDAADLLPKAWELAKSASKAVGDRASYDFRVAHERYCTNVVKQYCRARTFFIRDEPKFLEDFYVPASIVKNERSRVPKAGLKDLAGVARRTIVVGSGGSGKTIFMRHLLLDAIQTGEKYPVFIELRRLNDAEDVNLEELVVEFMHEHGFPLGRDFALRSLHDGLLVILLDGFDEVVTEKRKHLERQIRRLGAKSGSQIVVSSRQDSLLDGWDNFSTVEIAPLELEEACELIERIPFLGEEEIKRRFVKELRLGLFKSHRHFLSNPLLLSIMLLTYGDSADIPTKFSSFYEQAFAALYQKHDALKSGYRRERKVPLDILDFARVFSAFSAITYDKRVTRFSLTDGVGYVDAAKRLVGMASVSSEGFLDDARQAVCLLVEDGLDYAYVHRSFQEYFVARFINDAGQEMQDRFMAKLVDSIKAGYQSENVLQLVYEMNPSLVEDQVLIPVVRKFFGTSLDRKLSKSRWISLFKKVFANVNLAPPEGVQYAIRSRLDLAMLLFLSRNCCTVARPAPRSRKSIYDDLHEQMAGRRSQAFNSLPARSPIWTTLAEDAPTFSLVGMERLRLGALAVIKRSTERSEAVADIFDL